METFQVHILSADHPFYEGPCESLIVPTLQGQYGVLAHHCNTFSAIIPGAMTYRLPGQENEVVAVSDGIIIIENNDVKVLVDTIERPEEIDENRAKRDADNAKEEMLQKKSIHEYRNAKAQMARAVNRLRVKRNYDANDRII